MGSTNRPLPARGATTLASARGADRYFELKSEIHRKLLGVLNFERVSSLPKDRVRAEIGRVVERLLDDERVPMTTAEQTKIVEEVLDEVLGLGPLETLLKEPSISDILVNRYNKVFIERNGKLSRTAGALQGRRATCCTSSKRSSPRWAAASTKPSPSSTRACRTARASTPSFRRWRSTDPA